jgi:hypothetical protein
MTNFQEKPWIVEYHYGNATSDYELTEHETRDAAVKFASNFVSQPFTKYRLCEKAEPAAASLNEKGFFGDDENIEKCFTLVLIYHREESHIRTRIPQWKKNEK